MVIVNPSMRFTFYGCDERVIAIGITQPKNGLHAMGVG